MGELNKSASYGVQWVAEAAKWRRAILTGRHPTTGRPYGPDDCKKGARNCLDFARHGRAKGWAWAA